MAKGRKQPKEKLPTKEIKQREEIPHPRERRKEQKYSHEHNYDVESVLCAL